MSEFDDRKSIRYWENFLASYEPNLDLADDFFALETCKLALAAVKLGNFGVGSLIVNPQGKIVAQGHNQVFFPYFRSDRHGEMVVMNQFEEQYQNISTMRGYKLYTSLESCPMCMARLITSGCETVIHVADDLPGGMVHLQEHLPPVWLELAQNQQFNSAQCSLQIKEAAKSIVMLNIAELNQQLNKRSNCS
ncbi:cytosine/adenosine deaminase [Xenococcus sp. PCC 7305]|uniref:nucleoside deaminase n=1 Tax=Xenococcus sp. PCC 7305 TaxID=102125 RepID=UPI0002ACB863|nr:deaminase [Xenococcus sp. PCC 7305]ELS04766.1 cytosine/adenosine deaminase [Xenococcus sp. PCC 7305]